MAAAEITGKQYPDGAASRNEKLKRIIRETREASQMAALPSAIPGEEGRFIPEPTGAQGLWAKSITTFGEQTAKNEEGSSFQLPFAKHFVGPVFISYGPMLADGDCVVEEWESQNYAINDQIYNNYYVLLWRFDSDSPAEMHIHEDTMHVNVTYGQFHPSVAVPSWGPRTPNGNGPMHPSGEIESPFEIVEQFDLDPQMIRDVVPTGSAPPIAIEPGVAGNKALILALRKARASGSQSAVNSFYGEGFRHFIAGDSPLGWDHLPLQDLYAPLVEHLASPLTLRYGPVLADETRAFEQMVSFARLDDGSVYNNWHAFIHEIRDGKIVQTREYLDTAHIWGTLGRWAAWGDKPPTAPSRPRRSNLQGISSTVQYKNNEGPDLERWRPFPPIS